MKNNTIGENAHDPFSGRTEAVKDQIHRTLSQPFSGQLQEAMYLGNALVTALRILDGTYEVTESSFKITTIHEER